MTRTSSDLINFAMIALLFIYNWNCCSNFFILTKILSLLINDKQDIFLICLSKNLEVDPMSNSSLSMMSSSVSTVGTCFTLKYVFSNNPVKALVSIEKPKMSKITNKVKDKWLNWRLIPNMSLLIENSLNDWLNNNLINSNIHLRLATFALDSSLRTKREQIDTKRIIIQT